MYIATQFPLESTVNEFWRMMWEKKSNCIVMLADPEENPVRNCYISVSGATTGKYWGRLYEEWTAKSELLLLLQKMLEKFIHFRYY